MSLQAALRGTSILQLRGGGLRSFVMSFTNSMKRPESESPEETGAAKRQKCESQVTDLTDTCKSDQPNTDSAVGISVTNDTTVPKDTKPAAVCTEDESTKASSGGSATDAEYWRKAKKMILLLSYSGKGYLGMQRNPGCRTIEEDLLQALHRARAIPDQGLREQQSVWFQRAARTDKGVSAAKQSVSLRMVAEEGILDSINEHLPSQIRVFGMKRVTKKFDAKLQCCARTYLYMSPTFAFCPIDAVVSEEYRITDEVLAEVNRLFRKYVGTHNYHNFTSRRKPSDPSNNRYIMSMSCSKPFVKRGVEFVVITVKGQSFMLHQIRKMIGLVMAVSRGHAAEPVFERAWTQDRIDLPVAPALGLMLNEVHYDRYNKRFGSAGSKTHEDIEWSAQEPLLEEFKDKYIYSDMVDTELADKPMLAWLGTLGLHTFDVREGDLSPAQAALNLVEGTNGQSATSKAAVDQSAAEDSAAGKLSHSNEGSHPKESSDASCDQPESSKSDEDPCSGKPVDADRPSGPCDDDAPSPPASTAERQGGAAES